MCDMTFKNGKHCDRASAFWIQYEIGHANVLSCKMHFARAYILMLDNKALHDKITIKDWR